MACERGNPVLVRALIELKADVEASDWVRCARRRQWCLHRGPVQWRPALTTPHGVCSLATAPCTKPQRAGTQTCSACCAV